MKHYIIIGTPVAHSLSPAMHTAGYKALGIEHEFSFTYQDVKPEELDEVMRALRARTDIRGITVTMPHKEAVVHYLDVIDETAREIGAVNTIVVDDGKWTGYNTDWYGIMKPLTGTLHQNPQYTYKCALLIGIGGAAKAAVYALKRSGYQKIFVTNRTVETGRLFADRYGLTFVTDTELPAYEFNLIFNATPIGMGVYTGRTPISASLLHTHQIVFDSIYHPRETQLLYDAGRAGSIRLYGWQMLLHQGARQFELYTKRTPPLSALETSLHT